MSVSWDWVASGGGPAAVTGLGWLAGVAASGWLAGVVADGSPGKRVQAGVLRDGDGKPKLFTLSLERETITLDPGKTWIKADGYKWVTRGLIEPPQSFHVEPDGTIDVNGEKIRVADPEGPAKLEHEINKHHVKPTRPEGQAAAATRRAAGHKVEADPHRVHYKVRLDHLGHLAVECHRGADRTDTGLRGLASLIVNGWMTKPNQLHVDALQRGVELDGQWFECSPSGAQQLEAALNERYSPKVEAEENAAIEIRENPASATGFDIHFVTVRAGARFEITGHLSQEKLDTLQDQARCELLRPGVILRLSPPNLLFRQKRPDGGEEPMPSFPDIQYRRVTAQQLQHLLNHPRLRRAGSVTEVARSSRDQPAKITELRLRRNPENPLLLWVDCLTTKVGEVETKAFTHHNVADLQHAGIFLAQFDVTLSLDHRRLSILDQTTHQERNVTIDHQSSDDALQEVSRLLSSLLKPVYSSPEETTSYPPPLTSPEPVEARPAIPTPPLPTTSPVPKAEPLPVTAAPAKPLEGPSVASPLIPVSGPVPPPAVTPPATPQAPLVAPALLAVFRETDPLRVNLEVFGHLAACLGAPPKELSLSLPRVFENRRFEVLSFGDEEIETLLDLRSEAFYGFYLSHNSEQNVLLVYAGQGRHLEFGRNRCLVQASATSEPSEFKGPALLGLAQNAEGHFVFVVQPTYREWVKSYERFCHEVYAHFATLPELSAKLTDYTLIWPELAAAEGEADASESAR